MHSNIEVAGVCCPSMPIIVITLLPRPPPAVVILTGNDSEVISQRC